MPTGFGNTTETMRRRAGAVLIGATVALSGCAAHVPDSVVQASTTAAPARSLAFEAVVSPVVITAEGADTVTPDPGPQATAEGPGPSEPAVATDDPQAPPPATFVSPSDAASAAQPPVELAEEIREFSGETPPYRVEVGIPSIVRPSEAAVERANAAIEDVVLQSVEPFIGDVENYFEGLTAADVDVSELTVSASVTFMSADLLSLRITEDARLGGGVAPVAGVRTLVLDLTTGDTVSVDDMVVGSEGIRRLAALVETALIETHYGGDADAFEPWESSIGPEYFGLVAVGPEGFEVSFAQFEAGADTLGTPMVMVPYAELEGLVAPWLVEAVG